MRICFVTGEYPPMQGGVGDCTHQLGRALIKLGHHVTVVTSSKAAATSTPATLDEPVVCATVENWNWTSWAHILEAVDAHQSEVLHIQYQTAAYAMHPAINFLPLRLRLGRSRPLLLITYHDLRVPYLFPKAGALRPWITLLPARWSDGVIATNAADHEHLRQAHLGNVLRLIPIGSNIRPQPPAGYDRASWRARLGISADDVLLCYFGFLNESKGGETLFRSLAELVRRGRKAKVLMIGGQVGDSDPTNTTYFEQVKALSSELGLTDRVLWTGYTPAEEVSANFLAADICVLPYRDGVSFRRGSFMAALAHGLPIVSTQPQMPIPALVDGDNIVLIPAEDPQAAADALERLISAPALRARLASGALDLAKSFTWERIAAQTSQLYRELTGNPSPEPGVR
jgi:glycosyltransferase involved in cell wall biosynthesis